MIRSAFGLVALGACGLAFGQRLPWMPLDPGPASGKVSNEKVQLGDRAINAKFDRVQGGVVINSPWTNGELTLEVPFELRFKDGSKRNLSNFKLQKVAVNTSPASGYLVTESGTDSDHHLSIRWHIDLRPGAHYLRESLELAATDQDVDLTRIEFGRGIATDAVTGSVQGSPIMIGGYFVGLEHPMSLSAVGSDGAWSVAIERKLPIRAGQSVKYSAVIGVAPEGQMRRAFLAYVEQQRARRYEPFLHYNSWYDLGYFNRYTADECVERINVFGDELAKKRGVKLRSFLFDDGWDNTHTVWKFNSGFPDGFTPLKVAAEKFGAGPGVWLSPWGGYGDPHDQRVEAGKAAGMELDSDGYALSGQKYYDRFHAVCMDFVDKYGVNQFKFDGTGSPDTQYPGSQFSSDFEAAIALIHDLRLAKPGLFINLTTGTWPSPFWTRFADSIWRGGEDHSFAGVGPWRQKWITYRDSDTYQEIVKANSYYPLNSLMLHGLIYAQYADHLKDDPANSFRNEVRTYFGNGTQLQEMYITPKLLSPQNWDDIAASAKWSFANRDVLVDTHWVGGDPSKLEVYGWASWAPRKAILTLRNPSDKPQTFHLDARKAFELPVSVHGAWSAKSPYPDEQDSIRIPVDEAKDVELQPFEVKVLEGSIR